MEPERQLRPLLIAAGIAVAVLALLLLARVDAYRCTLSAATKAERTTSRVDGDARAPRSLRLWLDAGDLAGALERVLSSELAKQGPHVALKQQATGGGQVTVRVDDASLYTPLYARPKLSAAMHFETHGDGVAEAQGEVTVQLSGTCYGVIAPARFREVVAGHLARPLAAALGALE